MSAFQLFVLVALLVVAAALAYAGRVLGGASQLYSYLKRHPKISRGIVLFLGLGLLSAFVFAAPVRANSVDWFSSGKLYLGLDNTLETSPLCYSGEVSDRLTSHGGLIVNVLSSADGRFEFNAKYTHHSCAFNDDRESYDSVGLSVEQRLW